MQMLKATAAFEPLRVEAKAWPNEPVREWEEDEAVLPGRGRSRLGEEPP